MLVRILLVTSVVTLFEPLPFPVILPLSATSAQTLPETFEATEQQQHAATRERARSFPPEPFAHPARSTIACVSISVSCFTVLTAFWLIAYWPASATSWLAMDICSDVSMASCCWSWSSCSTSKWVFTAGIASIALPTISDTPARIPSRPSATPLKIAPPREMSISWLLLTAPWSLVSCLTSASAVIDLSALSSFLRIDPPFFW
mmetsp:Transcript_44006/g.145790  ORF Transcript_44006/g.145790 Transcript_44006/m.145790 type:complete len:204 (+) Transcript_44006:590-1201(+)